jgi:hypothetical protein
LSERENAYTDSLGTLQSRRDFSTGRSSGGVRLGYPIAWSETIALMPYVGLYGDYYFTRDDAASIVVAGLGPLASIPLLEGWSAGDRRASGENLPAARRLRSAASSAASAATSRSGLIASAPAFRFDRPPWHLLPSQWPRSLALFSKSVLATSERL